MTDAFKKSGRAEADTRRITESSDAEVREYFNRGIKERWQSVVVRRLKLAGATPKHAQPRLR
jgi:hypothetical protein